MTPDARVLRFPSTLGAMAAEDYGRFTRELSPDELAGCFFFTDDDRRRIASRRRDASRLGFAVQLGTVRYLPLPGEPRRHPAQRHCLDDPRSASHSPIAAALSLSQARKLRVLADQREVVAAGLLALAIGQQLVWLGLGLLAQEPQRGLGDPGDLIGDEAKEPQRAQLDR